MRNSINWKIFSFLFAASLVSVACVFPYVLTVQGAIIKKLPVPVLTLFFAQIVQCAILFAITIFLGLFFTKKIGFHLPFLEAIFANGNYKKILKDIAGRSVALGIAVAVAIYAADYLFSIGGARVSTHAPLAPVWQTLLAAFYGGIVEEVLLRLFLMTLFIWISMKLTRTSKPTAAGIAGSIIVSAIIFGLGHLPITASVTQITPIVVARAVVLNGIAGIVFGWLFWKKGLESAMIAHFTADIVLLTLLPMIIK